MIRQPAFRSFEAQADSIIPGAGNSQAWDRYAYANNNPLYYTDPSGHVAQTDDSSTCVGDDCATAEELSYLQNFAQQNGCNSIINGLCVDSNGNYIPNPENDQFAEEVLNGYGFALQFLWEPADWAITAYQCTHGDCSPLVLLGLLPLIPSSAGSHVDDIIDAGRAVDAGTGFTSFSRLKKSLGDAGDGMEWHHIVEQSQIKKSGFSPQQIHNVENAVAVDAATHRRISGFYSSNIAGPGTQRVRDWLAGQSFEAQYKFGNNVLKDYGVIP